MKVKIRETTSGTEYWDTENKKTLFVPKGEEPDFEFTVKPESMIIGVDLAGGEDMTVIDGEVIENELDLESMTVAKLKEYAAEKDIKIPAEIKKRDDIIIFLSDAE